MRGAVFAAAVLMAGACAADSWTLARRTADSPQPEAQAGRQEWACCEMETNAIDLLVVFDASACRWLGEHGTGHEQYAETCIKDLNRSLSYTEIDRSFSFRLAGVLNLAPIDFGGYELSDVVATFSPALSAKRLDGHVAEKIRLARDDTHADVVAILTLGRTPNIYGYSISLKKENFTPEGLYVASETAYCACRIDAIEQRHVLLHEIGHLLGAGHSEAQHKAPGPALFAHSAAYRFHAGAMPLTTITGYPEEKGDIILPFFSSPDFMLTYVSAEGVASHGIPVGTPTNDNTRTVLATYPFVAQYRVAKPTESDADFDRKIALALEEDGRQVGSPEKAVRLRCGVKRSFKLTGLADDALVTVRRLPAGLLYDAKDMAVSGRATEAGGGTALFVFRSRQNGMVSRRRVVFSVEALPAWATGTFESDSQRLRIGIAANGLIRVSERRAYRVATTKQKGFSAEGVDSAGNPVFTFEDGKKLICVTDAEGGRQGAIVGDDGTILCRAAKKAKPRASRRRKSESRLFNKNKKEKKT